MATHEFDVFFDYRCPFVYNAEGWLAQVREARGADAFHARWRPFSLEQINQTVGPEHKVWEVAEEEMPGGIMAHRAGRAALRQGEEAFARFHPLLLKARHEDRADLADRAVLEAVAGSAGLAVDRFKQDLADPSTLTEIVESHTASVAEHGVFGTPTFVFANGAGAFLKLIKPGDPGEAVRFFDALVEVMEAGLFIGEIKRPQPPWPKGVLGR